MRLLIITLVVVLNALPAFAADKTVRFTPPRGCLTIEKTDGINVFLTSAPFCMEGAEELTLQMPEETEVITVFIDGEHWQCVNVE